MLKTAFKVIMWCIGLMVLPVLALIVFSVLGVTLPLVGILMTIFLPIVLIGTFIGYRSAKKKFR